MTGAISLAASCRNVKGGGLSNGAPNILMKPAKFNGHLNAKVGQVMHEFKQGMLHTGAKDGPIVRNKKQAIAIALSEVETMKKKKGKKKGR